MEIVCGDLPLEGIRPNTLQREKGRTNMTLFYKEMKSPVGKLKLVASAKALVAVLWEQERPNRVRLGTLKLDQRHPILVETERQLSEYFAGESIRFEVPIYAR